MMNRRKSSVIMCRASYEQETPRVGLNGLKLEVVNESQFDGGGGRMMGVWGSCGRVEAYSFLAELEC